MGKPEPWQKTGRRAKEEHWLGLEEKVVIEASLYDDRGQPQGRGVIQLERRALEDQETKDGQTWKGKFLAIEDDYYEWWVNTTFPGNLLPFHFCARQVTACRVATLYRQPIHIDVFRILPDNAYESLVWLKDAKKEQAKKRFDGRSLDGPGDGDVALVHAGGDGPGPGAPGTGEVADGIRGIEGLAAALGQPSDAKAALAANEELRQAKRQKVKDDEQGTAKPKVGLQEALQGRKAPEPELSALKMRSDGNKKKKDKKKKKKNKSKKSKKNASGSSGSDDSESSSSSTGSLFRLAALPQGVDKLHRLHQEKPGALANLTLRRFQELLNRSVGRGSGPSGRGATSSSKGLPESDIFDSPLRRGDWPPQPPRVENSGHHGGSHGVQRPLEGDGRGGTEDEGHRALCDSGAVEPGQSTRVGAAGRGATSILQTGTEGSPAGTQERVETSAGPMARKETGMELQRSRSRGREERRGEQRRRSTQEHRGGSRERKERKRERKTERTVVTCTGEVPGLEYEPLAMALRGDMITEDTRMKVKELMKDPEVIALHKY